MSVTASSLRKLAQLQLSAEQMAGVLEILADNVEAEEARKAAQRDRTRRHRANRDSNVTVTSHGRDAPLPLDKERSPHTPLKKLNPNPPISPQTPFSDFWKAYPRKVAKGPAEKAWAKAIKKTDPSKILSALAEQKTLWAKEGTEAQFIPHPATWLNGERWADEVGGEDEPEVAAAKARGLPEVYWTWPQNREWLKRIFQLSQGRGKWMNHWSAPPGEPDCTCPKAILEAFPEAVERAREAA